MQTLTPDQKINLLTQIFDKKIKNIHPNAIISYRNNSSNFDQSLLLIATETKQQDLVTFLVKQGATVTDEVRTAAATAGITLPSPKTTFEAPDDLLSDDDHEEDHDEKDTLSGDAAKLKDAATADSEFPVLKVTVGSIVALGVIAGIFKAYKVWTARKRAAEAKKAKELKEKEAVKIA